MATAPAPGSSSKPTAERYKLTAQVTERRESLGERIKEWAHRSDEDIEELARIVADRAKVLGVTAAHCLETLQKHLLQYLISTYLLDPIPIKLSTGPSTLGAASVNLQSTVTLQPSVSAGPDVVQGLVASLFKYSSRRS